MSATTYSMASSSARSRPALVVVVGMVVALIGITIGSGVASAHTSFGSSNPADGAVLAEPVDEILIAFTNPATEAGDGFVVLDPSGQVRAPSSVTTDDGTVFRLAFEPPLDGGQVGVRWSVRAGDAHPIEGSFAFTVGDATAGAASAAAAPGHDMSSMSAEEMAAMTSMDEFLAVDQSPPGESLARIGRLVSFAAIVLGIGAIAFAATTLRGSRDEIDSLITAVRILGGVLVVGAIVEYAGVARIADDAITSAWTSSAGFATLLRAVAGAMIAFGLAATTTPLRTRTRALSAAARATVLDERTDRVEADPAIRRWTPDRSSVVAFVGVGLAVV